MAKRITDTQRIINFGMAADEAALAQAIESLQAIRSNRFPKTVKVARKARADKGTKRTPPAATDPPASGE